jgi:diaminopimelate decarboxylase
MAFEAYDSQGLLYFTGQSLSSLIKQRSTTKGFYAYSLAGLSERARLFSQTLQEALPQKLSCHFAMKSNNHPKIIQIIKSHNMGVDIVSGGELTRALECGIDASDVVFSGVGKSIDEIQLALSRQVGQFNVESLPELERIEKLAKDQGVMAQVVLRLNPNVDAKTHPYIATGIFDNKFGLNEDQFVFALDIFRRSKNLQFRGISCHIGSQILDVSVFRESLQFQRSIFEGLRSQGFAVDIFNVGGGLGIDYQNSADSDQQRLRDYAHVLGEELKGLQANIQFEPGRFLVARFGFLLTQVEYIKKTEHKNFLICNSGMNHLLRPALYGAKHRILPVIKRTGENEVFDVVGPVCESSDFFAKSLELSPAQEGDWLCIMDAGAYGASMASRYNLFDLPDEVFF